jgi:hypothetical protein
VVLSHRRPVLATACARKDLGEGPFPGKCKVRRLFDTCGSQLVRLADGHFEPEGTSISPRSRAFARSRRGDLGAPALSTANSGPGSSWATRREVPVAHRLGLRAAMRALERWAQPTGSGASRTVAGSLDRGSVHPGGGRGHGSLPSVLGFHLDRQTVGGPRAKAHARPNERHSESVRREAVHARLRRYGRRSPAPSDPPQGVLLPTLSDCQRPPPRTRDRKKTPVWRSVEVAEAGSAP